MSEVRRNTLTSALAHAMVMRVRQGLDEDLAGEQRSMPYLSTEQMEQCIDYLADKVDRLESPTLVKQSRWYDRFRSWRRR